MAEDFFDLSGFSDDDWKDMENPSPVPAGWYRARVAEVDTDANSGNLFLHFQITAGPFKGKKIKETLWNPENADSEDKSANSRKKKLLFATRLGLITAADKQKRDPHFRIVWDNALGVEVWIKVEQRTFDRKDKVTGKPTGEKGTSNQLTFDGVYPINDERVPQDVRLGTATGQTAAASTGTTAAGAGSRPAGQTQQARNARQPAGAGAGAAADISDVI